MGYFVLKIGVIWRVLCFLAGIFSSRYGVWSSGPLDLDIRLH